MNKRVQVKVGSERVVPVAKFRGSTRPVLIAGSKGQILRTLQAAKPFISELRLRGVSVIPLESDAADFTQTLKSLKQEFKYGFAYLLAGQCLFTAAMNNFECTGVMLCTCTTSLVCNCEQYPLFNSTHCVRECC